MVTIDSQQHKIFKDLANAEENVPCTPLLGNEGRNVRARMQSNRFHCKRQRCCVSSKAAILILMWNLILIVAGLEVLLDPNFFGIMFGTDDNFNTTIFCVIT
jgi:hypothetical protein